MSSDPRPPSSSGRPLLGRALSGAAVAALAFMSATSTSMPAVAAPTTGTIYVANSSADSVTEYALGSNGDVAPAALLEGASTGLSFPTGVAVDSSGDLFVANLGNNSITEYAPGAAGNASPLTTISGTVTQLSSPEFMTFDRYGDLWVASAGDYYGNGMAVLEFGPHPSGGVAPILVITGPSTGLNAPFGVALDSSDNVWVADRNANLVEEFANGAHGDVAPTASISGPLTGLSEPEGIAVDASDNVVVGNFGNGVSGRTVTDYAHGATGNVAPGTTIGGTTTGLVQPEGIALDGSGNVFVSDRNTQAVFEFASGANGDVAPITAISGVNTRLSGPEGVALFSPAEHPTATAVTCAPASIVVGQVTTCTVKVDDTAATSPSSPAGSMSFASSDPGSFGAGSCTLAPTGPASGGCSVSYTPSAVGSGSHAITASYGGDATHAASTGSTKVAVAQSDNDLALAGVPADQTVNATSPGGATVSYTGPTATDEETPPAVSCDHASGSTFPIGTTTVHCSVTDPDDNPSTVSAAFNVTVIGAAGQLSALIAQVAAANISATDKAVLTFWLTSAVNANNAANLVQTCAALRIFSSIVGIFELLPPPYNIAITVGRSYVAEAVQIRAVLGC